MARERPAKLAILESEKLIERAMNCHRFAVGVDDPQFTLKLSALAAEYEARTMGPERGRTNSFRTRPGVAGSGSCVH
jgi:hypothetical protein